MVGDVLVEDALLVDDLYEKRVCYLELCDIALIELEPFLLVTVIGASSAFPPSSSLGCLEADEGGG